MISFVHMFAKHRVAANLLMVIMIIAGVIGVDRLRTQFFPSFELDHHDRVRRLARRDR